MVNGVKSTITDKLIIFNLDYGELCTLRILLMSRFGKNYLEVGQLTETILPMHNVRFIAVNDGVDSDKGEDDFTPFRNIMNGIVS